MIKNILGTTFRRITASKGFLTVQTIRQTPMFNQTFRMMSTPTPVDTTTYIKEMKEPKDWEDAMENVTRPILIQAGASWCGPCQHLKPLLLEAVKKHNGAIEYLYVDVDKHGELAQML